MCFNNYYAIYNSLPTTLCFDLFHSVFGITVKLINILYNIQKICKIYVLFNYVFDWYNFTVKRY